jgi:hypothetical protein
MRTAAAIADQEIRNAEGIHTVDPQDPNAAGHQLWGHRSKKSLATNDQNVLEIALPSDDHVALLALIARIEKLKGQLPPDVQVLRRNLAS